MMIIALKSERKKKWGEGSSPVEERRLQVVEERVRVLEAGALLAVEALGQRAHLRKTPDVDEIAVFLGNRKSIRLYFFFCVTFNFNF